MFERFHNLFKQGEQINISTKRHDRLLFRDAESLEIQRHVCAHRVIPVDCPWPLFRRPIDMGHGRRHNQQLVRGDFVPAAVKLTPACSFGAIDKNRLRSSMLTRARMAFRFGIVPGIGRHQISKEWILYGFFENGPGDDDDALSLESFVFLAPFHVPKQKTATRSGGFSPARKITGFAYGLILEKPLRSSQKVPDWPAPGPA